jgi:ATP-dependent RNA helicase RhlE
MKFEQFGISAELTRSLEEQGYKKPTDIQFKAIPSIMKGEDVLAIAQTGTGKTAAYAIPIIDNLHRRKRSKRSDGIRCLVMVPTHELAIQTSSAFASMGKHTKVKAFGIFGGVEQDPQIAQLNKGLDILVATPGRVFDLINQGHLHLKQVEVLILDEADHMLDLGFYKDIQDLLRHLPRKRQTLFFSATINQKIKKLAYSLVTNPIRIQISPKNPVNKNIEHAKVKVSMDDKRFFLERLINEQDEPLKMLVFVRTRVRAERVKAAMARVGIESITLHGEKEHKERLNALEAFRSGEVKLLIATDVSARGIDIPDVEYVVNYDLPDKGEVYVHRVGRTGRASNKGWALSFYSEEEKEKLMAIEEFIGDEIPLLQLGKKDYEQTLSLHGRPKYDWKSLINEMEEEEKQPKKRKKKRK